MQYYDAVVVGGGPSGTSAATTMAKQGLKVLLVEQGGHDNEKPCGGIIPSLTEEIIEKIFGRKLPESVKSIPSHLGLYYWPPSGFTNGGRVKNYRLTNLYRSKLDEWLRDQTASYGVEVIYNSKLVAFFEKSEELTLKIFKNHEHFQVRTNHLVGADGIFSLIRQSIFGSDRKLIWIAQENWDIEGTIENNFYVFLDDRYTDYYGYLIPKEGHLKIGLGVDERDIHNLDKSLTAFRELVMDSGFNIKSLIRRDKWAIPESPVRRGQGNILLVGDAGGFCNPFSGEGIRLGIESGEAAGQAIIDSIEKGVEAESIYERYVSQHELLINQVLEFLLTFKNIDKENYVKTELLRSSLL